MILTNEFLLFYIIYALTVLLILHLESKEKIKNEKIQALIDIYMLPITLVAASIYILIKSIGVLVGLNKHRRDCFTIHNLTAKNKITLKEIGFEYGEFINENNINYKGYRYNNGRIVVLLSGRVNYAFNLSDEEKVILELVKNLPNE